MMGTGENFDQGGFARAVFTDQPVDFTGHQAQINILQRNNAGEALAHILHFKNGTGCR